MSRASARATLGAIGGILKARDYEVTREKSGRLWVDGACVARPTGNDGDLVLIESVVDGIDATLTRLPEVIREPSAYTATLYAMAIDCEVRILLRRREAERLADMRRATLAGYTCPGEACREALCDGHKRPAEAYHV